MEKKEVKQIWAKPASRVQLDTRSLNQEAKYAWSAVKESGRTKLGQACARVVLLEPILIVERGRQRWTLVFPAYPADTVKVGNRKRLLLFVIRAQLGPILWPVLDKRRVQCVQNVM